jgi:hypothetical protein
MQQITNIEDHVKNYISWEECPLNKWKIEDIEKLDFRTSQGFHLKKETKLNIKQIKEIVKYFKKKEPKELKKPKDSKELKKPKDSKKPKNSKELKGNIINKNRLEDIYLNLLNSVKYNEKLYGFFLGSYTRILLKQKGPAYFNRNKSSNPEDFCSFDEIIIIPRRYFHSFYNERNMIFSFDVRSLMKLVKSVNKKNGKEIEDISEIMEIPKNPYTGIMLPKYTFQYIYRKIEKELKKPRMTGGKITKEQKIKNKIYRMFHHIDSFGYITNLNWFSDMNLDILKHWYRLGEDLWNYRAQLSNVQKRTISPLNIPFKMSVNEVYKIRKLKTLQNIILNQIENLIMHGENVETQSLGCIYVLMIFSQINPNIALALPGIAQY